MTPSRRTFTLGAAALWLTGCGGAPGPALLPAQDPALRPEANPGWDAWVAAFRPRALSSGIAPGVYDAAFARAGFLPGVIERDRKQTEFSRTLEDYLAITASEDKVAAGRAKLRANAALLAEIEARYGVPARVTCAVWGMESNYGARRGEIPVVSACSTLAYDGRRGPFFESQLLAALKILQRGDTSPERLVGSWAGAMGHTQFIPTTYQAYAVDFRGDGRRDIWSEDPTDGLASAAAYLSRSGWRTGQPWGQEVALPAGFDPALAGRGQRRSDWSSLGVRAADGRALAGGSAALLLPQGPGGPAFLAYRNFDVILRYNNSVNYGIGVGYLSDRLAGAGPLRGGFPPDANGMTIEDRRDLQRRLTAAGFDTGGSDGVIGSKTEAAIRAYEARAGLPVTGRPSPALLARLR